MIGFLRMQASLRRARKQEQEAEKYMILLLTEQIRLKDVPPWLLRNVEYCSTLYISAFRVDRSISRVQYEEDLIFLEMEILRAEVEKKIQLKNCLQRILKEKQSDLDDRPEMMRWN